VDLVKGNGQIEVVSLICESSVTIGIVLDPTQHFCNFKAPQDRIRYHKIETNHTQKLSSSSSSSSGESQLNIDTSIGPVHELEQVEEQLVEEEEEEEEEEERVKHQRISPVVKHVPGVGLRPSTSLLLLHILVEQLEAKAALTLDSKEEEEVADEGNSAKKMKTSPTSKDEKKKKMQRRELCIFLDPACGRGSLPLSLPFVAMKHPFRSIGIGGEIEGVNCM
jgi:hypothetical protein